MWHHNINHMTALWSAEEAETSHHPALLRDKISWHKTSFEPHHVDIDQEPPIPTSWGKVARLPWAVSKPGGLIVRSVTTWWLTTEAKLQSPHHRQETPTGSVSVQTCLWEDSLSLAGWRKLSCKAHSLYCKTFDSSFSAATLHWRTDGSVLECYRQNW